MGIGSLFFGWRIGNIGLEGVAKEIEGGEVRVDDAYGLEIGVDYCGADEFHATLLEVVGDAV